MSQEKVNAYKASKKTRKEDLKKAKKVKLIQQIIGWVAAAALVGLLVFGIVRTVQNSNPTRIITTSENFVQTVLDIPDIAGIADIGEN